MKKNLLLSLSLLAGVILCIYVTSCSKGSGKQYKMVTITQPVYTSKASVLAGINGNSDKPIDTAGKIYVAGSRIFISETFKGIHIIDNSNPSAPRQVAFLSIPGNQDIALKGNTLYADMYGDLLAIDISNPGQVKITGTIENFFAGRNYLDGMAASVNGMIATGWQQKDTLVEINQPVYSFLNCMNCSTLVPLASSSSGGTKGTAGSMAGMVIVDNNIYAIAERHSMGIADISNAAVPKLDTSFFAGFDLETIYPFGDRLFLGSSSGVFMYDISNPAHPVQTGTFTHGRACDPVISDGDYAYVTLHAGTSCGGAANELDVLDVKDPANASLVKTYPLTRPTGLSKDGNLLFVGDGPQNVKVFDASDPADLKLLQEVASGQAYDVITQDKKLVIVSDKGIYQYSYDNSPSFKLLSLFPIGK